MQMLLAFLPGGAVSLVGLYGLAMVQMARAGVDSAEYGQQALHVSRQQLEVSRQALAQGKAMAMSYAQAPQLQQNSTATDNTAANPEPSYSDSPDNLTDLDTIPPLPEQSRAALAEPVAPTRLQIEYKGKEIKLEDGVYSIGRLKFQSEKAAKSYLDGYGLKPNPKQIS